MPKDWIYQRKKDELIVELTHIGLPTEGTIEDLRRRLSDYVTRHPAFVPKTRIANRDPLPAMQAAATNGPTTTGPTDTTQIINQIRKWGCGFDGRDPWAFLERIEELSQGYGYTGQHLLMGLPEMLRGDTLLWYRNNRSQWRTWEEFCADFRAQYLPRQYHAQLRREINDRKQKNGEKYAKYATDLQTLMRRSGGYSAVEQVEQLYENLHPDYKLYVRRANALSIRELQVRATEYEEIHHGHAVLLLFGTGSYICAVYTMVSVAFLNMQMVSKIFLI